MQAEVSMTILSTATRQRLLTKTQNLLTLKDRQSRKDCLSLHRQIKINHLKIEVMKSAKISMLVFMLYFTKVGLINLTKLILDIIFQMLKVFFFFGIWTLPLVINSYTFSNTNFNIYYLLISVGGGLLGIIINGIYGDMEHAVYLHKEKYKLSCYYRLLVKVNSFF